jgi:hypothetical protein
MERLYKKRTKNKLNIKESFKKVKDLILKQVNLNHDPKIKQEALAKKYLTKNIRRVLCRNESYEIN